MDATSDSARFSHVDVDGWRADALDFGRRPRAALAQGCGVGVHAVRERFGLLPWIRKAVVSSATSTRAIYGTFLVEYLTPFRAWGRMVASFFWSSTTEISTNIKPSC